MNAHHYNIPYALGWHSVGNQPGAPMLTLLPGLTASSGVLP